MKPSVPIELKGDVEWLRRFINCAVFSPPPEDCTRAQGIVDRFVEVASALRRIVEEAKPVSVFGEALIKFSTVPTSAIEAASKVLERVRD